jgi:hypothetical protein
VNEHIFCAAVRSDKTEAFVAVKPFHSSLCHTFQLLSFRTDVTKNILTKASTAMKHTRVLSSLRRPVGSEMLDALDRSDRAHGRTTLCANDVDIAVTRAFTWRHSPKTTVATIRSRSRTGTFLFYPRILRDKATTRQRRASGQLDTCVPTTQLKGHNEQV